MIFEGELSDKKSSGSREVPEEAPVVSVGLLLPFLTFFITTNLLFCLCSVSPSPPSRPHPLLPLLLLRSVSHIFTAFFLSSSSFLVQILSMFIQLLTPSDSHASTDRRHEQRLLCNMGLHTVVIDLLQVNYMKVLTAEIFSDGGGGGVRSTCLDKRK